MDGRPFVFFAPRGGELSDMTLSAVMRRMQDTEEKAGGLGYIDPGNKRPAVPHGLRSTFRQWAAERGYPRDMAEIALAHFIGSEVERAYQRSDMLERRRAMMADGAGFLRGKVMADNVVNLGAAGCRQTPGTTKLRWRASRRGGATFSTRPCQWTRKSVI
jgi:hypothetical protein